MSEIHDSFVTDPWDQPCCTEKPTASTIPQRGLWCFSSWRENEFAESLGRGEWSVDIEFQSGDRLGLRVLSRNIALPKPFERYTGRHRECRSHLPNAAHPRCLR